MEHIPYESYDTTDPESMSDLIEALQKQAKVVMTEADIKAKVKGTKPEYWFYERLSDGSGGPQMAISIAEDGAGNVFLYSVNDDTVHVVPMGETFNRMSHGVPYSRIVRKGIERDCSRKGTNTPH